METNHIEKEIMIEAPVNLVWHAWTISERVTEWFAPEAVVEAKVSGAYELYFIPGNKEEMNTRGCTITKLLQYKELHFTWKGPDPFKEVMNETAPLTEVHVSFEKIGDEKTKIVLKHIGFHMSNSWEQAYNWHQKAWDGVLNSLKDALLTGTGLLCCQPS